MPGRDRADRARECKKPQFFPLFAYLKVTFQRGFNLRRFRGLCQQVVGSIKLTRGRDDSWEMIDLFTLTHTHRHTHTHIYIYIHNICIYIIDPICRWYFANLTHQQQKTRTKRHFLPQLQRHHLLQLHLNPDPRSWSPWTKRPTWWLGSTESLRSQHLFPSFSTSKSSHPEVESFVTHFLSWP